MTPQETQAAYAARYKAMNDDEREKERRALMDLAIAADEAHEATVAKYTILRQVMKQAAAGTVQNGG